MCTEPIWTNMSLFARQKKKCLKILAAWSAIYNGHTSFICLHMQKSPAYTIILWCISKVFPDLTWIYAHPQKQWQEKTFIPHRVIFSRWSPGLPAVKSPFLLQVISKFLNISHTLQVWLMTIWYVVFFSVSIFFTWGFSMWAEGFKLFLRIFIGYPTCGTRCDDEIHST